MAYKDKAKAAAYMRDYRLTHPDYAERSREQTRAYHIAHKDELLQYWKDYRVIHQEHYRDYHQAYCQTHKEERRPVIRDYNRKRMADDIQFRMLSNLRARLNRAVRNQYKSGSAVRDLGCSISEFRVYLEGKFLSGMSWDNWGKGLGKWNIDHLVPISSVDLTQRDQLLKVCHFSNLQPLWAIDNLRKGAHIPEG